jgi:hypothetical protein
MSGAKLSAKTALTAPDTTTYAYVIKGAVTYKLQLGVANGLPYLDGTAKIPTSFLPSITAQGGIASSEKGAANGVASLDSNGRLPSAQLTLAATEYKGTWNASTNTPTLSDGTGSTGDTYRVSVGATRNLGSGNITFDVGDWVIHNGSIWEKLDTTDAVSSVNGATGAVTITLGSLGGFAEAGGTFTGKVNSQATGQTTMASASSGLAKLAARSANDAHAAFLEFDRNGQGVYFGLSADLKLRVGGWSWGANHYEVFHEGNTLTTGIRDIPVITANANTTIAHATHRGCTLRKTDTGSYDYTFNSDSLSPGQAVVLRSYNATGTMTVKAGTGSPEIRKAGASATANVVCSAWCQVTVYCEDTGKYVVNGTGMQ